jgi:acyl-CoA reductase-like NAD-dependent aldehyde dehydrogenase
MKMIIGGERVDASDGEVITVDNPFSHEVIGTVPSATYEDVQRALEIAQSGKREWASTPSHKRAEILVRYAGLLEVNRESLAALSSAEQGKPLRESLNELDLMVNVLKGYVERAKHLYGLTLPIGTHPGAEEDVVFTRHEPLGVIACFIPFNYPLELYIQKVAPALAAGNAVIVKPSTDTPMGAIRLTELIHEAGVPGNVVQVLTGNGSRVGTWIVSSDKIDGVSLTGSTETGIMIAREASNNLHHVFLELGGNDPLIIFEDADLDQAVEEAVFGRTYNAGQTCCAAKRFLVQRSIVNAFTEKLIGRLATLRLGDPFDPSTDMGPLINARAADLVGQQVLLTMQQGARLAYGFKKYNGNFVEPVVLTDVREHMDIARDMEVFGPVFAIIAFDDERQAVAIANGSKYGLNAGVMSGDMARGVRVAQEIESGTVVLNACGLYRTPDIAFGGYKMSGLGREGVSVTLEEMTQIKTVVMKNVLV